MISFSRVSTVVYKDLIWSANNLKLLSVMLVPAFLVVFFSKLDAAGNFGISITFINSFVGLFTTSYLIIEEKNKGTLLSLLTTPLTSGELLMGKFLFTLLICSAFSLMALLFHGRMDVLLNPIAFFNLALFAGMSCFLGCTLGMFFKNEQEMSVVAPVIMIFFVIGGAVDKVSPGENLHAFFPDYHMAATIKDIEQAFSVLAMHSAFNLLYFAVCFFMAASYANFYFSNSREKRLSKSLITSVLTLFVVFILSGAFFTKYKPIEKIVGQASTITGLHWDVEFMYNDKAYKFAPLFESRENTVFLFTHIKEDKNNMTLSVRKAKEDEKTPELRYQKVLKDKSRVILSHNNRDFNGEKASKWVYSRKDRMIVLYDLFCQDEILQFALDVNFESMKNFEARVNDFRTFMDQIKINCRDKEKALESN